MKKTTLLIPLVLIGCAELEKLKEDLSDITNDFVISTFYIGTAEFTDDRVDLSTIEEMQGTQAATYLVSAEVMDGSEPSPVTRADVVLTTDGGTTATLEEDAGGLYSGDQEDGLDYQPGELVTVTADYNDETHTIAVTAPEPPEYDAPEEHALDTELMIDISGQGYDSALVFVAYFGTEGEGGVVYSNKPEDFQELYSFAYPDETSTDVSVTIPAETFENEGLYVISLGGVVAGENDDMDNVNVALSSILATQMVSNVVCVPTCVPDINE